MVIGREWMHFVQRRGASHKQHFIVENYRLC